MYFQVNTTHTSASGRWEAFKAYIRGQIISSTSSKSNKFRSQMSDLEKEIKQLERDIALNDTPDLQCKLTLQRAHYNELSSNKALASINRLKQSFYDQGEKAGKLLAWRIKALHGERAINKIQNNAGNITSDPKEINESFKTFYNHLYKSEPPGDPKTQSVFLDGIHFPFLSEE